MRTHPIASFLFLAAILVPACSDDGETCADGDCSSGPGGSGSGPTTTATSTTNSTGQGGSGGGVAEPLNTEVHFVDYYSNEPIAAAPVLVSAADGSIASQSETGSDGSLAVEIPAGGSVSVFQTTYFFFQGNEYELRHMRTVFPADAKPDRITFQGGYFLEPEPGSGVMQLGVSWNTVPNAGEYLVKTNCFSQSVAAPTLTAGGSVTSCTNDGLYDVLFAVYDQSGALAAYNVLADQPFLNQGTPNHQMSPGNGQVADIPYSITNLPDEASSIQIASVATRTTHGVPITLEQKLAEAPPNVTELSGSIKHAVGFGSKHCTTLNVDLGSEAGTSANRCGPTAELTPFAFDASRLTRFTLSGKATPTSLSWTEMTPGELGDWVQASVSTGGSNTSATIVWSAILPPGAGSVTRPELPADLGGYAVDVADSATVINTDLRGIDGFEAALEAGSSDNNEWTWRSE